MEDITIPTQGNIIILLELYCKSFFKLVDPQTDFGDLTQQRWVIAFGIKNQEDVQIKQDLWAGSPNPSM